MSSETCCDVLEMDLNYPAGALQEGSKNPGGAYKKERFLWNDMVVYHNSESNFYLYNSGIIYAWVVSIQKQESASTHITNIYLILLLVKNVSFIFLFYY